MDDETIVFIGGCNNANFKEATEFYDLVFVLNIKTGSWKQHQVPELCLSNHAASAVGDTLYISGGYSGNSDDTLNHNLYSLNIHTMELQQLSELQDTPHIFHKSACISRLNILFFSCKPVAEGARKYFNMIHLYDIKNDAWLKLPVMNTTGQFPPYREKYSTHKMGNKVYLFGGCYNNEYFDDLWLYDAKANSFTAVYVSGHRPSPRYFAGMTVTGNTIHIFGGIDPMGNIMNDYYQLDTTDGTWVSYYYEKVSDPPPRIGIYSLFSVDCNHKSVYLFGGSEARLMIEMGEDCIPVISKTSTSSSSKSKRLTRSVSPSNASKKEKLRKKKPQVPELLELVTELEDYTDTLSQGVIHLITILQPLIYENNNDTNNNNTIEGVDPSALLKGLCQDLKLFIDEQKPNVQSQLPKPKTRLRSNTLKQKSFLTVGRKNSSSEIIKCKFDPTSSQAMFYYNAMNIPPVFVPGEKPSDFSSLSKHLQKSYFISNEIISTETDFVRDLGALIALYMRPLQNEFEGLINQYDFHSMFKNTETLFEFNSSFLERLIEEHKKPSKEQDFGGVFLEMMDGFKNFLLSCANQYTATETCLKLDKESTEFQEFSDYTVNLSPSKNQQLESFIIKPFQRICRYPLLLKELLSNTPKKTQRYYNIQQAISEINVIVRAANDSKKQTDNLVEIMEIQNQFVFGPADSDIRQMHKWEFVKEGTVKLVDRNKITKQILQLVLFKECLIIAQSKSKKLYRMHHFKTSSILIYDTDSTNDKKSKGYPFSLVDITNNTKVDVACNSLDEKNNWITTINECGSVE